MTYYASLCEEGGDEVERARRFLVRTWQSVGGKTACRTGWGHDRTNQVFMPKKWARLPERILQTVERLRMAQIENKGYCIVSAYENELYNTVLEGWEQRSMRAQTTTGKSAVESVYLNPACMREISLFG